MKKIFDPLHSKKRIKLQQFTKDSDLLRKLVQNKETLEEFKTLRNKGLWNLYCRVNRFSAAQQIVFWNNQNIIPSASSYNLEMVSIFKLLDNGYYVIIKKSFALNGTNNKFGLMH